MMGYILDDALSPADAAHKWLSNNPEILNTWLSGVTTLDGKDGLSAVQKHLAIK